MALKPKESAIVELAQAVGQLVRRFKAASNSDDLSLSEISVLARLAKHGPAITADLARELGMRPQSMRPIVATLEKESLIARKPHPTDGRQVHLLLTKAGAAKHRTLRAARRHWLSTAVAKLPQNDRQTLLAAGPIINRMLEDSNGRR